MSVKMIVVVTGSRTVTDREAIFKALDGEFTPSDIAMLYHGDAEGVDKICADWATENGVAVRGLPIPREYYDQYGKGAGNMRNKYMLGEGWLHSQHEGLALNGTAFWDGSSTGTKDMIDRMRQAGVTPTVHLMGKPKTKRLLGR